MVLLNNCRCQRWCIQPYNSHTEYRREWTYVTHWTRWKFWHETISRDYHGSNTTKTSWEEAGRTQMLRIGCMCHTLSYFNIYTESQSNGTNMRGKNLSSVHVYESLCVYLQGGYRLRVRFQSSLGFIIIVFNSNLVII